MSKQNNPPPHYPETPESPLSQRLTLAGMLEMLKRRWFVATAFALLISGAFAAYFLTRTPVYESSASVVVEINADRVTEMQEVVDTGLERGMLDTIMNTHRERLRNKAFASRVINNLSEEEVDQLYKVGDEVAYPRSMTPEELLRTEIVETEWIPDTQVIEVNAKHSNPALAQKIARQYTEEYVASVLEQRSSSNSRASQFLQTQAERLKESISESEQDLQKYRAQNRLVSVEDDQDIIAGKLSQINEELTDERVRVIGLKSTLDEIENADGNRDQLLSIEEINTFEPIPELVVELEGIRNEHEILKETFLSEHPAIKKNRAEERAILSAIDNNIAMAVQRMEQQLTTAQRREQELSSALITAEDEAQELDRLAIEHNVLQRRLDTQKKTYDQLVQRLNETSISSELQNSNVRILAPADYPVDPVEPDPLKISLASGLVFALILLGLPIVWEGIDTRLKTFAEIESFVGKPVMGHFRSIRKIREKSVGEQMKNVEVVEGFRLMYAQISLQDDSTPLTLMVSSTTPDEGKSFVASNLAVTCARHGKKTILLDADLRRSCLHEGFGLKNSLGLNAWYKSERRDPKDLGITEVGPNLDLLPSGSNTDKPTELIQSPAFNKLLEDLKKRYEVVIIDTPPVGPCPDALFLARHVNHTLFVARQNANSRHKIRSAVRKLDRTSAPVIGLVLNRIIGKSADAAYANYHSEYGFNYGYSASYYSSHENESDKRAERSGANNGRKRLNESLITTST